MRTAATFKRWLPWNNNHEAIIWLMLILLLVGSANILSSTFILAENEQNAPYAYLLKHGVSMVIGIFLFALTCRVDYHKWRELLGIVSLIVAILLVLVLFFGTEVNGARRWIYLGAFSFQPAEFAKICSVMMAAYSLSYQVERRRPIALMTRQNAFIVGLAILVELEPDLGTASVIIGVPMVMICMAGLKTYKLQRMLAAGVLVVAALCIYQPYRLERVRVLLDPWADAQGMGYQTVQSITAIGSGGFWGMGLGQGLAKYAYLPEAHTDFAFAVFCQENGFLLAVLLLLIYCAFAYYAARIAGDAHDIYGQLLASGIMVLVVGQAVVNILMVSGCFPVVGVPLPFVSYGGTSLMMTMASVGVLVNINRYSQAKRLREKLDSLKNQPVNESAGQARPKLRLIK
ncbi:MAG: putative peptidoglycan glycosyltransferase FtsW [Anaerovibrio sp.]|nr:putative peptidoglycan glycosyltransferase FtsW [Anaerovibrio sp.]